MVDPLGLIFQELFKLMQAKISAVLMIITSEFFIFNVWEWFLRSSVLERTESDLSKINWLRGVILLNPIVLVPWGRFPLCHTPIRPISTFRDQISILIVSCVITRFALVGIRARLRNKVISFCYYRFFSVSFKFFSVCVHLLVLHVCVI